MNVVRCNSSGSKAPYIVPLNLVVGVPHQDQSAPQPSDMMIPEASLFCLPPEIRMQIYDELLPKYIAFNWTGSVAFFRTCRQIHQEAADYLFSTRKLLLVIDAASQQIGLPRRHVKMNRIDISSTCFHLLRRIKQADILIEVSNEASATCEARDMFSGIVRHFNASRNLRDLRITFLRDWDANEGDGSVRPEIATRFILDPLRHLRFVHDSDHRTSLRLRLKHFCEGADVARTRLQVDLEQAMRSGQLPNAKDPFRQYFCVLRCVSEAARKIAEREWKAEASRVNAYLAKARIEGDMTSFGTWHEAFVVKVKVRGHRNTRSIKEWAELRAERVKVMDLIEALQVAFVRVKKEAALSSAAERKSKVGSDSASMHR